MAQPEKIMPGVGSSPDISPQAASVSSGSVEAGPKQPSSVLPQRFYPVEGVYDPTKTAGYVSEKVRGQTIFRDPATGQEVARIIPDIGGASDEDEVKDDLLAQVGIDTGSTEPAGTGGAPGSPEGSENPGSDGTEDGAEDITPQSLQRFLQSERLRQLTVAIQHSTAEPDSPEKDRRLENLQSSLVGLQTEMGAETFPEISDRSSYASLTASERTVLSRYLGHDRFRELQGLEPATFQEYTTGFFRRLGTKSGVINKIIEAYEGPEKFSSAEASEVADLTVGELDALKQNGWTVAKLKQKLEEAENASNSKDIALKYFRTRVDPEIATVRLKHSPKTEANKEWKEVEDKTKELEGLITEKMSLRRARPVNLRDRLLISLMSERNEKELRELLRASYDREVPAAGGAGGPGGPGGTEILQPNEGDPIPPEFLEQEATPERGRQIASIIQEETAKLYAGRLKEVNWKRLEEAYRDQRIHVESTRLMKLKPRKKEDEEEVEETKKPGRHFDTDKFKDMGLEDVIKRYKEKGSTEEARKKAGQELDLFFEEAERLGLIDDLKSVLVHADRKVRKSIAHNEDSSTNNIMAIVRNEIEGAAHTASVIFENKAMFDPEIEALRVVIGERSMGIWDLYAQRALTRLAVLYDSSAKNFNEEVPYLDHEYHLGDSDEYLEGENFWQSTHGWYIEVSAKTEKEFRVAVESYLRILQAITNDPKKILESSQQFVDVLSKSDGAQELMREDPNGADIIKKISWLAEGRSGVFGAYNSNELYNHDFYNQFMSYINKDGEGPDRWLELIKSMEGLPVAVVWALDNDPRWEILYSLHGPKGELAAASYAQRTRGGDHSGLYQELYDMLVEETMGVYLKNPGANINEITKFMSKKNFASYFHGLHEYGKTAKGRVPGDANIAEYQRVLAAELAKGTPEDKINWTLRKYRRARLGKIQMELADLRERVARGEKLTTKPDPSKGKPGEYDPQSNQIYALLDHKDRAFYLKELDRARKAVDIGLQIHGAVGEKSKRGGGIFKTDRKVDPETSEEFQYFVPVHMGEKFVQTAVTLTRIKYKDGAPIWKDYKNWTDEIAMEIQNDNKANGRPEFKNFRARYRTRKVEEAIKRNAAEFRANGYEAVVKDEFVLLKDGKRFSQSNLGFDATGNSVSIFFKNGKLTGVEFDEQGAIIFDKPQIDSQGRPIKDRKRVKFDNLTPDVALANMQILQPKEDGSGPESVDADFYTAVHHVFSSWTGHTYWSYQEEDRHLVLNPANFDKAQKFLAGELLPEELDMWTEQLIIMDPTLKRLRLFEKGFEDRERKLTAAATEDSYQTHIDITDALYDEFFPKLGTPTSEINVYYGLQDHGGFRKMIEHSRARAAEDPERFARRGRRLIPRVRIPAFPLAEYVGQGHRGALGIFMMMDVPTYKGIGTFAWDKFQSQSEMAYLLYEALFLTTKEQDGTIKEPLLLKLTNESDTLLEDFVTAMSIKLPKTPGMEWKDPSQQQAFCVALRKSFGRLERYLKLLASTETLIRNASGAQDLRNLDIVGEDADKLDSELEAALAALPDITGDMTQPGLAKSREKVATFIKGATKALRGTEDEFNKFFNKGSDEIDSGVNDPGIDEGKTSADTGSGRHGAYKFFKVFMALMLDAEKGGGQRLYGTEKHLYAYLNDKLVFYDPTVKDHRGQIATTIMGWLFGKMVPT